MTIKPTPGSQPDTDDMAAMSDPDGKSHKTSPAHDLEQEEEEAARLGDFA